MVTMAYNKHVNEALKHLGIDPKFQQKKEEEFRRESRGLVDPRVAAVLEGAGVHYSQEEIIGEAGMSPLDMGGQEPDVDPNNGQRNGMQNQDKGQEDPQDPNRRPRSNQPAKPAQVKLKGNVGGAVKTLQDVSDRMTQVMARMKTLDMLIQALTEDNTNDNRIDTHKLTLQGPIKAVVNSIKDLQKLVE
jgi:hypothetical protein